MTMTFVRSKNISLSLSLSIIFTLSDLICKLWKWILFWIEDYTQKQESGVCLKNATMIQVQVMFENGKPDIVLKTVKAGFI